MADWYVATTGSDAGAGTSGDPWKTIQFAGFGNPSTSDGDTIYVATGTYSENYVGTEGLRVGGQILEFVATGGRVTVNSAGSTGSGIKDNVLYFSSSAVMSFEGFDFDASVNTKGQCLYLATSADNLTLKDCGLLNPQDTAIFGNPSSNVTIQDDCNIDSTSGIWWDWRGDNLTIKNSRLNYDKTTALADNLGKCETVGASGSITLFKNSMRSGINITGAVMSFANGTYTISITENEIYMTHPDQTATIISIGDQVAPDVSSNEIHTMAVGTCIHVRCYSTGGSGASPTLNYNNCHTRSLSGLTLYVGTDGSTANDNLLDGGEMIGNKIYGPIYYDPATATVDLANHALMYGFNRNATIKHNYVNGCGYGAVTKHDGRQGGAGAWTAGGVYGNVFVNNKRGAIRPKGVADIQYSNNTFISTLYDCKILVWITDNDGVANSECDGLVLTNNIYYTDMPSPGNAALISVAANCTSGVTMDYNTFRIVRVGRFGVWGATSESTLAGWQTTTGQEANSIEGDPLMVDIANEKFWLLEGSNCIDSGDDLGAGVDDLLLKTTAWPKRIITADQDDYGSAWDRGAFIYESASAGGRQPRARSHNV